MVRDIQRSVTYKYATVLVFVLYYIYKYYYCYYFYYKCTCIPQLIRFSFLCYILLMQPFTFPTVDKGVLFDFVIFYVVQSKKKKMMMMIKRKKTFTDRRVGKFA